MQKYMPFTIAILGAIIVFWTILWFTRDNEVIYKGGSGDYHQLIVDEPTYLKISRYAFESGISLNDSLKEMIGDWPNVVGHVTWDYRVLKDTTHVEINLLRFNETLQSWEVIRKLATSTPNNGLFAWYMQEGDFVSTKGTHIQIIGLCPTGNVECLENRVYYPLSE